MMKINNMLFRTIRGFLGLTQKQLGQLVNKSQVSVYRYENGTKVPEVVSAKIMQLAEDAGMTEYDYLMIEKVIVSMAGGKRK